MAQASRTQAVSLEGARKPSLVRAEAIDKTTRSRLQSEIDQALKRRPTSETRLAGVCRALAPLSPAIRGTLVETAQLLAKRGSFDRALYAAALRSVSDDARATSIFKTALAASEGGGMATLSAACFSTDRALALPLSKLASLRTSHVAFAADTARVMRGESNGSHLTHLAPMIKESHRLSLCVELFTPLARKDTTSRFLAPALAFLRDAERHLGRWLLLAEIATKAGDAAPIAEARTRANDTGSSSRGAWSLVTWALAQASGAAPGHPDTRPTVELVARLSDRPSADRDMTFLFRMARAAVPSARPMLDLLVKPLAQGDEVAIRAALHLVRDYGQSAFLEPLQELAREGKRDEVRGLATAALWDAGAFAAAEESAEDLLVSKHLPNVGWSALVRVASQRMRAGDTATRLVEEAQVRWMQWGWSE